MKTPLDANKRPSKRHSERDCRDVVDPHKCTQTLSQYCRMSLMSPGMVRLQAAERLLQYMRATYDQGISFYDLDTDKRNKVGVKV